MGWRDGPSGDAHPHLDKLPSSRRRNENNTCTATTRYAGYTECVLPEGHPATRGRGHLSALLLQAPPGHSVRRRQLIATWSIGVPVLTAMYSRAISSTSRG